MKEQIIELNAENERLAVEMNMWKERCSDVTQDNLNMHRENTDLKELLQETEHKLFDATTQVERLEACVDEMHAESGDVVHHRHWEDEIYQWGKGDDAVGDEVLCALNSIIRGLYAIDVIDGGFYGLCSRLNVTLDYYGLVEKLDNEIDLCGLACKFEVLRTLLFGSKINYDFLNDHMHKAYLDHNNRHKED